MEAVHRGMEAGAGAGAGTEVLMSTVVEIVVFNVTIIAVMPVLHSCAVVQL